MKQKHLYMTIDTETCGDFRKPLVYDLGVAVHDRHGNIVETRSWVIREVFYGRSRKMKTAYYSEKLPLYYEGIKNGEWEVVSLFRARAEMLEMISQYDIKAVIAYNAAFDQKALNCTMQEFSKYGTDHFFPDSVIFWDSWGMACETILQHKAYYKNAHAKNWVSDAGNCMSNAECAFRYTTKNLEFIEQHTALADVLVEVEIFAKVMRQKKKMRREIFGNPWMLIQPGFCKYVASVAGC